MDLHQEYIQELWMNQPPVPQVQGVEPQTPIVRLNEQDPEELDLFGDQRRPAALEPMDIESQCLRTKDLHHLKLSLSLL